MSKVETVGAAQKSLPEFYGVQGEIPSLDGLRAISILAVMMSHMGLDWFPGGHGVFLFFIISGFLITRLFFIELKTSQQVHLLNFYKRRFFRLYPVIALYCLVVPLVYFMRDGWVSLIEPFSALFYFSNYLVAARDMSGIEYQMPFKVFWSLSVEEHFYLLFPFVVLALRSARRIMIFAVCLCIFVLAFRMLAAFMWPEVVGTHYLYMRTEFRIDAVAYGVALAAACELPELRPILLRLIQPVVFAITLIVALAAIVLGGDWFANVLRYAILGPCMAILIMAILFSSRYETFQWALNLPAMAWTGRLSYSLYVWHIPCFLVSTWAVEGIGGVILSWPLSFIVAALSYYCVELPAIRYGKQFGGQRRAPIGQ